MDHAIGGHHVGHDDVDTIAYVAGYCGYHARNIDLDEAKALRIGGQLNLAENSKHNTQL